MRYCFATNTTRIEEVHVPGDVDQLFVSDPKIVSLSADESELTRKRERYRQERALVMVEFFYRYSGL
jgi:hypothetical protein